MVHAVFFNVVNGRVYVSSASVEIGGVNVYYKRFPRYLLGMYPGRVSEPVVCMYYVVVLLTSHDACHYRVIVYFLHEVLGVPA